MSFRLASSAFSNGEKIPRHCAGDGDDFSPELSWSGAPKNTRSFALVMHDPDASNGDFTHWLLWDIPSDMASLPESRKTSLMGEVGKNSFGKIGYVGPCPPPGHGPHRYFFELYALDVDRLELGRGADRGQIETAIQPHKLSEARLMGRYERSADATSS